MPANSSWMLPGLWALAQAAKHRDQLVAPVSPQAPPINPGAKPPLTIYPQVGPVEQMAHRALRERGLAPDAFAVARATPTRMIPMEHYKADGFLGGGQYSPTTGEVTMGYYPGFFGGEGDRTSYAHEIRHAFQDRSESPIMPDPRNDNTAFMRDFQQWASADPKAQGMIDSVEGGIKHGIYKQLDPWELDARVAADQHLWNTPPQTLENLPPAMQQYYDGWFQPGANPDAESVRRQGWQNHWRPGWR